jgi:PAS domain S-box-containing protein
MQRPAAQYGIDDTPYHVLLHKKEGYMSHFNPEGRTGENVNNTGRTHSQEAVLRSVVTLRDFVENAPEGLRRVGPDGLILWANLAELDMLGYTRAEYVGHHIAEFHADAEVIEDLLARLARGETLREREVRMVCKDGSIRHVLVNSNALFEGGKFIHTRCFTRDITEHKRDGEKMISAYERESAARALAEAASRSKDEFITLVLNALRSPLNVIVGCDPMLREDSPDMAQLKNSCDVIVRNAREQLQLIDDLLTPSSPGRLAAIRRLMSGARAVETYESSGLVAQR